MPGIIFRAVRHALSFVTGRLRVVFLRARGYKIGRGVQIGRAVINARECVIGDYAVVQDGVVITDLERIEIGSFTKVQRGTRISGDWLEPAHCTIGSNVNILPNCVINVTRDVHLGNGVCLGMGVQIWTHGAFPEIGEGYPARYAPVRVEDGAWLAADSMLLAGSVIGERSIVNARALVPGKEVPAGVLVAGVPSRMIAEEESYREPLSREQQAALVRDTFLSVLETIGYKVMPLEEGVWRCRHYAGSFFFAVVDSPDGALPPPNSRAVLLLTSESMNGTLSVTGKHWTVFDLPGKTYTRIASTGAYLFHYICNNRSILRFRALENGVPR